MLIVPPTNRLFAIDAPPKFVKPPPDVILVVSVVETIVIPPIENNAADKLLLFCVDDIYNELEVILFEIIFCEFSIPPIYTSLAIAKPPALVMPPPEVIDCALVVLLILNPPCNTIDPIVEL